MDRLLRPISSFLLLLCLLCTSQLAAQEGDSNHPKLYRLYLENSSQLEVMMSALNDISVKAEIRARLQGALCYHLGFCHDSTAVGIASYKGSLYFEDATADADETEIDYDHDTTTGQAPAIPPDTANLVTLSVLPQVGLPKVFDSELAFDFLLHVWDTAPGSMTALLSSGYALEELRAAVTTNAQQQEIVTLTLTYKSSSSVKTQSITAEHLGGIVFGPLTIL